MVTLKGVIMMMMTLKGAMIIMMALKVKGAKMNMMMMTVTGTIQDCLLSPRCPVKCPQPTELNNLGAIMYTPCTTHQVSNIYNVSCVKRCEGTSQQLHQISLHSLKAIANEWGRKPAYLEKLLTVSSRECHILKLKISSLQKEPTLLCKWLILGK